MSRSTGFAIHILSPAYIGMFAATVLGSEFMHRRVKTLRQRVANLEAAHANLQQQTVCRAGTRRHLPHMQPMQKHSK